MNDETSIEGAQAAEVEVPAQDSAKEGEQGIPLSPERLAFGLLNSVQEAVEAQGRELMSLACMPGLSHASFRLFVILLGVEAQKGAQGNYFPVTLLGLQRVHPGIAEKVAGFSTITKQVMELRSHGLLDIRASMPRNEPNLPILVRLRRRDPGLDGWTATDGTKITAGDVQDLIGLQ